MVDFNPFGQLAEAQRYKNDLAYRIAALRQSQLQNALAGQLQRLKINQLMNPPTQLTWKTGENNEIIGLPTQITPGQEITPYRTGITGRPDTTNIPSSVAEWQYYNKLPKEDQQRYLTMKRAEKTLDLGGSFIQPSSVTPGATVAEYPKTLPPAQTPEVKAAQEEATVKARKETEAKTAAQLSYPDVKAQADETISLVDQLLTHPGFKISVGKSSLMQPWLVPGSAAAGWKTFYDQVMGKQFMQAYQGLKGGGQITEVEGKKATEAMSRMKTSTSEQDFIKAARDFQLIIRRGLARAAKKAGEPAPPEANIGSNNTIKVGNFTVTTVNK